MSKEKPKIKQIKYISVDLKDYCLFAEEHDSLVITEWINDEGYDIDILKPRKNNSIPDRRFQFTYGELKAITKLYNKLVKND